MVQGNRSSFGAILLVPALALPGLASAGEPDATITIQGGKFTPADLSLPAGKKLKIVVHNADQMPTEFESNDLHREKVVQPGAEAAVSVGPLDPGTYEFFDDFHPEDRGRLTIK